MKNLVKIHKTNQKNLTYSVHLLKSGGYGFKLLNNVSLKTEQIAALNRIVQRKLKEFSTHSKKPKSWTLLQTNKTLTKLSLESRMGKGKGPIYTEVVFLKKGSIIYQFQNLKLQQIKDLYRSIQTQIRGRLKLIIKK